MKTLSALLLLLCFSGCAVLTPPSPIQMATTGHWRHEGSPRDFVVHNCESSRYFKARTLILAGGIVSGIGGAVILGDSDHQNAILGYLLLGGAAYALAHVLTAEPAPEFPAGTFLAEGESYREYVTFANCTITFPEGRLPQSHRTRFLTLRFPDGRSLVVDLREELE